MESHVEDLIEVRQILELAAVKMAAERRTLEDLRNIQAAQSVFCDQILDDGHALEEDLLFHLEVVSACKNNTLKSLFMRLFPDLFDLFNQTKEKDRQKFFQAIHEHENIIGHIMDQNETEAEKAMGLHLEQWKG